MSYNRCSVVLYDIVVFNVIFLVLRRLTTAALPAGPTKFAPSTYSVTIDMKECCY